MIIEDVISDNSHQLILYVKELQNIKNNINEFWFIISFMNRFTFKKHFIILLVICYKVFSNDYKD